MLCSNTVKFHWVGLGAHIQVTVGVSLVWGIVICGARSHHPFVDFSGVGYTRSR